MIPKTPYKAWEINEKDYPLNKGLEEKVKFLINYAILAPSSHNTQPWKFEVKENIIKIFPDLKRAVAYSDRFNRELYISLGCSLANILVASNHFNFDTEVKYFSEDDLRNPAISIKLTEKEELKSSIKSLFPFMARRVSNRNFYEEKKVPKNILNNILRFNDEESTKVHLICDTKIKEKIIKAVGRSVLFAFSDKLFKYELSHWVRSNYTKKHDGMPLFGFGIPGIISLFAPYVIKNMPARLQEKMDKDLLLHASVLIVISSEDCKESWIKVGKIYEYIALASLGRGVSTSPMAGVVEYEETNKKLKEILDIDKRPLFFVRMGYTGKIMHNTPRRNVEEVLL